MEDGLISYGDIDTRSIEEVEPADLRGYTRLHFFAGLGAWDHALNLAEWGDAPCWTGSCPCQPWSPAGKNEGFADPRHLWPYWRRLIQLCRPPVLFGENVDTAVKHGWWDVVCDDLEELGYTCGACVFPASSVGAPHRRNRLYFAAHILSVPQGSRHPGLQPQARRVGERGELGVAEHEGLYRDGRALEGQAALGSEHREPARPSDAGGLVDADGHGLNGAHETQDGTRVPHVGQPHTHEAGTPGGLVNPDNGGRSDADAGEEPRLGMAERQRQFAGDRGFWARAQWVRCRDGKFRAIPPAVESEFFTMVDGIARGMGSGCEADSHPLVVGETPNRKGRLIGYGNTIVAPQAAMFVRAFIGAKRKKI